MVKQGVESIENKEVIKLYLGTHNSMSYLKPKYWFMKPFNFIAKCQSKDIYFQLLNCKVVDLRIACDNNMNWVFRHGLMEYKGENINNILDFINSQYKNKIVRILLERTSKKHKLLETDLFKDFCSKIESTYTNIKFIGGNRKSDWLQVYDFKYNKEFKLNQFVGSMMDDARWYEKFIPYLYAYRMNHTNLQKVSPDINIFDFIHRL